MPIPILDLIALLLAPRAFVDGFMHITEDWRDWLNVWADPPPTPDLPRHQSLAFVERRERGLYWFRGKIAFLFNCAFCLSYHASFWLLLLMYAIMLWLPAPVAMGCRFFIYWLALTQVSTLLLRVQDVAGRNSE